VSFLDLAAGAAPATPSAGKGTDFLDSAGKNRSHVGDDGVVRAFTGNALKRNLLLNGVFHFAQRQTLTTLTTYSNTTGRTYGPDRWGITNENASAQFAGVNADTPEAGLQAKYYGRFKKITSSGKVIVSQALESFEVMPLRGRRVCVRFKARYSVAASMTIRCALLQLTSAGSVDTMPATFVSAFGGAGTDPTWGANLNAIVPDKGTGTGASIVGSGLTAVLAATWQKYTAIFTVPTTCKNLVLALFSNGLLTANDEMNLAEVSLTDGETDEDFSPRPFVEELQLVQRYYAKTFAVFQPPITALGVTTGCLRGQLGKAGAVALAAQFHWQYPTRMRVAPPTVVLYNPAAANAQVRQISGTVADLTASAATNINERCLDVTATGAAGGAVGDQVGIHVSADAEL